MRGDTFYGMDAEAEREEAEERIRLYPGCEGIRVAGGPGAWVAVMATDPDHILARRPTLPLLVDFFESHGGFAQET